MKAQNTSTKMFKPQANSWSDKVIQFLRGGASTPQQIASGTGMEDYYKDHQYSDHARYYLGGVVLPRLLNAGVVYRISRGVYTLSKEYEKFARNYE